jgi:hypothetical protein
MPAVASFPDYATGQIAPVTGEFRSMTPADPSYREDPLGSGGYPAYRPADRSGGRDRPAESPGGSFPGYADDGPPVYRDSSPPPAYRDDPPGAPSYRDDPLGSGGYPAYRPADRAGDRDRAPDGPGSESLPGHRNPGPYGDDPLGLGYRGERPPSYRDDQYPPSYRDEAAPYPGEDPGPRYTDDPFQSVYPDDARGPGYPDDERAGSHPYGVPPGRPEPRAPRGRS